MQPAPVLFFFEGMFDVTPGLARVPRKNYLEPRVPNVRTCVRTGCRLGSPDLAAFSDSGALMNPALDCCREQRAFHPSRPLFEWASDKLS